MDKAVIVLFFLLTGCTSGGSLCTAGPIILDPADVLTRSTLEQVVALNEAGEVVCGWSP